MAMQVPGMGTSSSSSLKNVISGPEAKHAGWLSTHGTMASSRQCRVDLWNGAMLSRRIRRK